MASYPCGDCGKKCVKSVVSCESCDGWFHIRCQKVSKEQFKLLSDSKNCGFYCLGCCYKNREYDFDSAIVRLGNYSKSGVLEEGVQIEKILLRMTNLDPLIDRSALSARDGIFKEDTVSSYLLASVRASTSGKLPIYVNGNGNSLFNAISMALFGHENLATEIRVRTCIELVENQTLYENQYDNLKLVSPSIHEACLHTALNVFSSAWAMVATATVIGCPIQSVYPHINGILDNSFRILNETFFPLGTKYSEIDPIFILWTSTHMSTTKIWTPNHFVPLLDTLDMTNSNQEYTRTFSKTKETVLTGIQSNTYDIRAVLNLSTHAKPFVREVNQMTGSPPNIVCYTENQLKHLVKASKMSEVRVDRTFQLGACYITTLSFQDFDLKRKGKDVSPFLLGPLYIHWDDTPLTYQRFFTHLAAVMENPLVDSESGTINFIGSDQETAKVKAIKASFPGSNLTLSKRHLGGNLKREVTNEVGLSGKNVKETVEKLPDIIAMLENEIKHQEALTRGALYGHGDYELSQSVFCLRTTLLAWQQKSENEKEQLYLKFLKFGITKRLPDDNLTDGKLVIPKTANPGQKRKIRKDSQTFNGPKRFRMA